MPSERALDWLRPHSLEPLVAMSEECVAAEAARREGLVAELWPGMLVARDRPRGAAERLAAVAGLLPEGAVLARGSAVWVHTGRHRPGRLDVILSGPRARSTTRVQVHLERVTEEELVRLPRGQVTSPARTAVDVARRAGAPDAVAWLAALHAQGHLVPDDIGRALERAAGLPGVARARELLGPLTA